MRPNYLLDRLQALNASRVHDLMGCFCNPRWRKKYRDAGTRGQSRVFYLSLPRQSFKVTAKLLSQHKIIVVILSRMFPSRMVVF
jgi:hypothetical protein